ncbi:MAG: hypothetical protein ACREUG_02640 [Steroidobacteraceae bacterium]
MDQLDPSAQAPWTSTTLTSFDGIIDLLPRALIEACSASGQTRSRTAQILLPSDI